MQTKLLDDCMFINTIDDKAITACSYVSAKHIIWDSDSQYNKQYLTGHHPVGVTLEYQKSGDYLEDVNRIMSDFYNIVRTHKSEVFPKFLYKADKPVTQIEQSKYKLNFSDFRSLNEREKKVLNLKKNEDYVPVFVNPLNVDPEFYCFLNKKHKLVV